MEPATIGVFAVYRRRLTDSPPSIRLLAVVRSDDEIQQLIERLGPGLSNCDVEWEELPLCNSEGPLTHWPAMQAVHLVSAGGRDNHGIEHNRAPIGLAAFIELSAAEDFAAAERETDPTVVVRTVPLSTPLIAAA